MWRASPFKEQKQTTSAKPFGCAQDGGQVATENTEKSNKWEEQGIMMDYTYCA
jgi:hypothetical protein